MIIHQPHVTTTSEELRVEAAVKLERRDARVPPALWFVFPRAYERFLSDRADGFAAGLLPLAMALGERMTVHGTLSYRLAAGMRDYQRVQSVWKPEMFRQVAIDCDGLLGADGGEAAGAVGMAFSGGVDSFYTLWAHLPENEPYPPCRVSHCVMIDGFDADADLTGTGSFRTIQSVYEPMLASHDIELLVARTNLLQFLGVHVRGQSFAAFLTAPALVLGRLFSRFYVPSGLKFTTMGLHPDGSHLMLDHLLSTETMETSHEDAHLSRFEKTVTLSHWPETYDRLRVCYKPTGMQPGRDAIANCCACEKCLRTMVTLQVAGALANYRCFPRPLTRRAIRSIPFFDSVRSIFGKEIIEYAVRAGRRDVARDVRLSLLKSRFVHPRIGPIACASARLEGRSKLYGWIVRRPKRLLKRLGFGRGWLY